VVAGVIRWVVQLEEKGLVAAVAPAFPTTCIIFPEPSAQGLLQLVCIFACHLHIKGDFEVSAAVHYAASTLILCLLADTGIWANNMMTCVALQKGHCSCS